MIYNEDCLEGMKRIESGSVDMILTDLPYGITDCPFDVRIPFEPMWEQFKRVTKRNAAILLFSQMPFGAELIMSNRKMFRYEWIWEKSLPVGFLNCNKMPLRKHENVLVFYQQLPTYNPQFTKGKPYKKPAYDGKRTQNYNLSTDRTEAVAYDGTRYPTDLIKFNSGQTHTHCFSMHAQRKPTDLLEYLIKTYTNAGELVLDATMGSGSTGVACLNTDRNFIGFETDKKFFRTSEERLMAVQAKKAQELF